ncbi:cytidylyltransferase domain-containing protein [Zavarzinia sp. CC-PAN008]|uniref:cytidylyltransferase domain-containing protein n=1 Tax=Zavarzinia sp. CC-PAN008 TaxID=3243332 RepID=UPI003F742B20
MTVLGLVQARCGSSRLPNKVLAPIEGRPMALFIADRLACAPGVDRVAIATTTEGSDDPLAQAAADAGIACHRGPVDDIAERLAGAAHALGASIVVRVWGDCPLIDPAVVGILVDHVVSGRADWACNALPGRRTYPPGLDAEVYRLDLLERLITATAADPRLREFPFEWVRRQPDVRIAAEDWPQDLSSLHLTVDYPADLEAARAIVRRLVERGAGPSLGELVALLRDEPHLADGFAQAARNIEYKAWKASIGESP